MELTLHTGTMGDRTILNIDWFDENNVHHQSQLELIIELFDKPRTVVIVLDKVVLASLSNEGLSLR